MTVSAKTDYFTPFFTNGLTGSFPFDFKINDAADITVLLDGLEVTTGFTVSGVGAASGSVDFAVFPVAGKTGLILLNPVNDRPENWTQFGDWDAAVANREWDRLWIAVQALFQKCKRAIKLPLDTSTDQALVENAAARADKYLGFDSSGNLSLKAQVDLAGTTVSAFMATLLDDLTAVLALATLGVSKNAYTPSAPTTTTNIDAVTLNPIRYLYLSSLGIVIGFGQFAIDTTTAAGFSFDVDPPVASNFAATYQASGMGVNNGQPESLRVSANSLTKKLTFSGNAGSTASRQFSFMFMMEVLP